MGNFFLISVPIESVFGLSTCLFFVSSEEKEKAIAPEWSLIVLYIICISMNYSSYQNADAKLLAVQRKVLFTPQMMLVTSCDANELIISPVILDQAPNHTQPRLLRIICAADYLFMFAAIIRCSSVVKFSKWWLQADFLLLFQTLAFDMHIVSYRQ